MATDIRMSEATEAPEPLANLQVKVEFTTRHADIELPENTGPILVPTRKYSPF
jgi:hypothetical protein